MAVTIEEALNIIYTTVKTKSTKILPIENALGSILAQDVIATHNLPPYDNSAMDGFAVKASDAGKKVNIQSTIFAGDKSDETLQDGYAIKIMTGAKIPYRCDCIVPIEDVQLEPSKDAILLPEPLASNKHIRKAGEDIRANETLLLSGDKLFSHHITLLASQGITHVKVYQKPKVAIFASGSELKMHFETLEEHQLYNTNTPTFFSRSQELNCEVDFVGTASDSLEDIKKHIQNSLHCDLIVTSGGVSVGDADFTKEAFSSFGYEIFFEKVDIKPGKPTTFGKIANTYVLNLPGNPLAAALNFELFAQSIFLALSGASAKFIQPLQAKMKHSYLPKSGKRTLIPGIYDGEYFEICNKFAPGMITPLAGSNAYIMLDANCTHLEENTSVRIVPTRFMFYSKEQKSLISKH